MRNTPAILLGALVVVLIGIGGFFWYVLSRPTQLPAPIAQLATSTDQETGAEDDTTAITTLVKGFGSVLKNVSLQAPKDILAHDIQQQYAPYVTPELLAAWMNDPTKAPGRLTSSPWPDRIEISSIQSTTSSDERVMGNIIEVTSVEEVQGGAADERPITLVVAKRSPAAGWFISQVVSPSNMQGTTGDWVSTTTASGLQFRYPAQLTTQFIQTQDWPPSVTLTSEALNCATTSTDTGLPTSQAQRLINGNTYCVDAQSEGAAGTIYTQYRYSTIHDNHSVQVSFTLRYPQCANYDEPNKSACVQERTAFDLDALIDGLVQSITTSP